MGTSAARMVGRDRESQTLLEAFEAGQRGQPRAVVVRGEAGIGKTRLLQEFRDTVLAAPASPPVVFAVGQCIDVGGIGSPFTPIRRLLRELYAGVGEDEFSTAAGSPAVLGTLAALLPDLETEATGAPGDRADFVTEAVERLIEHLSAEHHLVLVVEDLHWADSATLDLLRTLAVTLRGAHVTVILTYRSDDVGRTHPLRPVLTELDRSRVVVGLELTRLGRDDVIALATQLGGVGDGRADDERLALALRSEGVPFFVEELVALDGAPLPDSLRAIVLARFERLGDTARDTVGTLAAGGVRVDDTLLAAVDRNDPGTRREALREALSANVIELDGDAYAFRHALIREMVHDDLLPSERSDLHRRYAAALQAKVDAGASELAADTAEHWLAAREVTRAFAATVVARDHARRTAALSTAALLGERLIDLWSQVEDAATLTGTSASRLATAAAWEWSLTANVGRALRLARSSVGIDDDEIGQAMIELAIARGLGNSGRLADSSEAARRVIDRLARVDDPVALATRARALALLAVNSADVDMEATLEQAIDLATRSGDDDALAYVLLGRAWYEIDSGRLVEGLATTRRCLRIGSPIDRIHAAVTETDALVRLGAFDEAVVVGEAAISAAVDIGLERGFGVLLAGNVAEARLARGDADQASRQLTRARALLADTPIFQSFVLRLAVQHASWNDDEATGGALRLEHESLIVTMTAEDPEERLGWAEVTAECALNRLDEIVGDARIHEITTAVESASAFLEPDMAAKPGLSQRVVPAAARALAEARLAGVETDASEALWDALERMRVVPADDQVGSGYVALVAAERLRGDRADSAADWLSAVESEKLPIRLRHYARFRLAEAMLAESDATGAAAHLALLAETASGHGVALVARWARALASRAHLDIGESPEPAASVPALTPREAQVLALVADGLSNPEIGRRLYISPKTASVHVSAILAKVGARSRSEAAALYAAEAADSSPDPRA